MTHNENENGNQSKNNWLQIILAVIPLLGTIISAALAVLGVTTAAVFANWKDIFSTPDKPSPTPSVIHSSPLTSTTKVSIQFAAEAQQNSAEALRKKLNSAGFVADGVENVGNSSPEEATVRYFYQEDLDAAKHLQDVMSKELGSNVRLESLLNYPTKNPAGMIEAWYPLPK
jgi:hypothetical protein